MSGMQKATDTDETTMEAIILYSGLKKLKINVLCLIEVADEAEAAAFILSIEESISHKYQD
jgi:hypothetical protein